jgi:uncharacterized membrane protein YdjX (TVP38/TMEM64 family)
MTEMTRPRAALSLRRALPLILIACGAVAGYLLLRDTLTFEAVSANREALLGWRDRNLAAAAAAYMAVYVTVVAFSLPGAFVMTVTGGFLFGLFPGVPLAVLSATIGATLIFLAARAGLGDALYARLRAQGGQGFFARIEAGLRENQVSYLLLMRLVPAVPFVIANLAPAFFGVSLRTFFLTTLFGILPGTFITTWIGVGVGEVFDRGETPGAGLILEPHILGPILGLCALAALPILIGRRRRGGARP